ncbi:hypothetical protein NP493_798g00020 [Ridgeia piscesae]|uniref:Uncharacterized protein n=1 Tax=Ridgeia piscesae TaxID=27915 RepID=A0AAD9KNI5_RIDPI|nr:hypothetical protein NP493_798g00020 [Ridgeia piscesae]
MTKVGDVKRYLKTVSVVNDGVLIVRDNQLFQPPRERIVVPRPIVDGRGTPAQNTSGFVALVNDSNLAMHGIRLEVGHVKNVNKTVAEHAIKELGIELLQHSPDGGPLLTVTLALATANLNSRIRRGGLSARELWTKTPNHR